MMVVARAHGLQKRQATIGTPALPDGVELAYPQDVEADLLAQITRRC